MDQRIDSLERNFAKLDTKFDKLLNYLLEEDEDELDTVKSLTKSLPDNENSSVTQVPPNANVNVGASTSKTESAISTDANLPDHLVAPPIISVATTSSELPPSTESISSSSSTPQSGNAPVTTTASSSEPIMSASPTPDSAPKTSIFETRKALYSQAEILSPPVDDNLAAFINEAMTHPLPEKELDRIRETYHRPENVNFLLRPTVNRAIWDLMPHDIRGNDLNFQYAQDKIISGILPLVQALNICAQDNIPEALTQCITDATVLFANSTMEYNLLRREAIRPRIAKAGQLANKERPITTELFGDDVEADLKRIETSQNLTDKLKRASNNRFDQPSKAPNFVQNRKQQLRQKIKKRAQKGFLGYRAGSARVARTTHPAEKMYKSNHQANNSRSAVGNKIWTQRLKQYRK